jgi:hypothetical protein
MASITDITITINKISSRAPNSVSLGTIARGSLNVRSFQRSPGDRPALRVKRSDPCGLSEPYSGKL